MFVVPLEKDMITTKDGQHYRVIEYTNYKEGGPAVYAKAKGEKTLVLVYFFDIARINGTQVDYQRGTKVFNALGRIERAQHLPQPDDKITLEDSEVEVRSLKLKSKTLGINRGLFFKDTEDNYHRIKTILDIDRALGGNNFDRDLFLLTYHDYAGV